MTTLARAWIDDAAEFWRHECYGYGPDPDDDDDRDTSDDTAEIEVPVFLPEDDGAQDCGLWFPDDPDDLWFLCEPEVYLTLAEHEAETAAAVRAVFPTADVNLSCGRVWVPADETTARGLVRMLAGCRCLQTGAGGSWFELTP